MGPLDTLKSCIDGTSVGHALALYYISKPKKKAKHLDLGYKDFPGGKNSECEKSMVRKEGQSGKGWRRR